MKRKTKILMAVGAAVLVTGAGIAGVSTRAEAGIAVRAQLVEALPLESVVRSRGGGWLCVAVSV
jgi:hypothetical protein